MTRKSEFPFKGNVDLDKLEKLIRKYGAEKNTLCQYRHQREHGRWTTHQSRRI